MSVELADIDDDLVGVRYVEALDGFDQFLAGQLATERRSLLKPSHKLFEATNEFIASTPNEGRDGDIIEQTSWRLANYRRNPVVLDNHDMARLAGRSVKVGAIDLDSGTRGLGTAIQWDEGGPLGAEVGRQHREGFRQAVSVRWRTGKRTARNELPKDHPAYQEAQKVEGYFGPYERAGYYLQRCELLEISSVTVPGDPGALQTRSARTVLDQVPDRGLADELEARIRAAIESPEQVDDPFIESMRGLVLSFVRSDEQLRLALRALCLPDAPTTKPDPWVGFFQTEGGA